MAKNEQQDIIPEYVIDSLARCLFPAIQAYFESSEGQAAFERWKKENKSSCRRADCGGRLAGGGFLHLSNIL